MSAYSYKRKQKMNDETAFQLVLLALFGLAPAVGAAVYWFTC